MVRPLSGLKQIARFKLAYYNVWSKCEPKNIVLANIEISRENSLAFNHIAWIERAHILQSLISKFLNIGILRNA